MPKQLRSQVSLCPTVWRSRSELGMAFLHIDAGKTEVAEFGGPLVPNEDITLDERNS